MEKKQAKKLSVWDGCVLALIIAAGAAIFTPGVTQAVQEKKLSDMVDCLQVIRSQIMLYKAHHNGLLPGQQAAGDSVTSEGFIRAMAQRMPDGSGPYLRRVFDNPYVADPVQRNAITCVNGPDARPTGSEGTAWWFNAATGDFSACDSEFHTNY